MAKALNKQRVSFVQNYLIDGYEVDFLIPEAGLVIEIDGFTHLSKEKLTSDQSKDRNLHDKGYTIIRFENQQVHNDLEECVKEIKTIIQKTRSYLQHGPSVNIIWKDALKPIKQKIESLEMAEKDPPKTVEAYFLSLDEKID